MPCAKPRLPWPTGAGFFGFPAFLKEKLVFVEIILVRCEFRALLMIKIILSTNLLEFINEMW